MAPGLRTDILVIEFTSPPLLVGHLGGPEDLDAHAVPEIQETLGCPLPALMGTITPRKEEHAGTTEIPAGSADVEVHAAPQARSTSPRVCREAGPPRWGTGLAGAVGGRWVLGWVSGPRSEALLDL